MPTKSHRETVLASIAVIDTVGINQLDYPTPCAGWNLLDLLAHMTVQHRGFAAAARGLGADVAIWQPETLRASVAEDPGGAYAAAARDALDAFSAEGVADATFALPEFGTGAAFPGTVAMGFHFVDYVVHGWDVAAALGVSYHLADDVLTEVEPLVFAVPDGDFRAADNSPFAPALASGDDDVLGRILRHLGRDPHWKAVTAQQT